MRPETLRALEGEDFDAIGHTAFVRSHLHSYARFLGIDPAEVVDAFAAQHTVDEPSAVQELERQRKEARKPPRPKWLVAAVVSGAVLIAGAVVGVLGGQGERPAGAPAPDASLPEVIASASGLPVPIAEARVRLRVEALKDTSFSILADGQSLFEGPLAEGIARTYNARSAIEIILPDAGTVRLWLNGRELGTPGEPGVVFRQRYGPDGPLRG